MMLNDSRQVGAIEDASFSVFGAGYPYTALLQPLPSSQKMLYAGVEHFQELDGVASPKRLVEQIWLAMEMARLAEEVLVQSLLDHADQ